MNNSLQQLLGVEEEKVSLNTMLGVEDKSLENLLGLNNTNK